MKKSFISLLLSCAMIFTSLTVPVFADTADDTIIAGEVIADDAATGEVITDDTAIEDGIITEEVPESISPENAGETTDDEKTEMVGNYSGTVSNNYDAANGNAKEKYTATLDFAQGYGRTYYDAVYRGKKIKIKPVNTLSSYEFYDYATAYTKKLKLKRDYTVSYNVVSVAKKLYSSSKYNVSDTANKDKYVTIDKKGAIIVNKGLTVSEDGVRIEVEAYYTLKNGNEPVATSSAYIYLEAEEGETKLDSIVLVPTDEGAAKYGLKTITDNKQAISANMLNFYYVQALDVSGNVITGDDLRGMRVAKAKNVDVGNFNTYGFPLSNTGTYGKASITVRDKKKKATISVKTVLPELEIYDYNLLFSTSTDKNRFLKASTSFNGASYGYICAMDKETDTPFAAPISAKGAKLKKYSEWKHGYYYYVYTPTSSSATLKFKKPSAKTYNVTNTKYAKTKKAALKNKTITIKMPSADAISRNAVSISLDEVELKKAVEGAKYAWVEIDTKASEAAGKKAEKAKDYADAKGARNTYNGYVALEAVLDTVIGDNAVGFGIVDNTKVTFAKVNLPTYTDKKSATSKKDNIEDKTPLIVGTYKAYVNIYNDKEACIAKAPVTIKVVE